MAFSRCAWLRASDRALSSASICAHATTPGGTHPPASPTTRDVEACSNHPLHGQCLSPLDTASGHTIGWKDPCEPCPGTADYPEPTLERQSRRPGGRSEPEPFILSPLSLSPPSPLFSLPLTCSPAKSGDCREAMDPPRVATLDRSMRVVTLVEAGRNPNDGQGLWMAGPVLLVTVAVRGAWLLPPPTPPPHGQSALQACSPAAPAGGAGVASWGMLVGPAAGLLLGGLRLGGVPRADRAAAGGGGPSWRPLATRSLPQASASPKPCLREEPVTPTWRASPLPAGGSPSSSSRCSCCAC